ncbi:hypothetical protein D9C73_023184 [Collichthys lucidus]|uniref:UPAR/Ly6 domain-containing protein n=1 Tax=Collichthys lucidus TaxID=240159 RepID=A0A4U5VJI3_COLLU|nr:hypothetical protein D9C73_023184 [Collichthys lucidus]
MGRILFGVLAAVASIMLVCSRFIQSLVVSLKTLRKHINVFILETIPWDNPQPPLSTVFNGTIEIPLTSVDSLTCNECKYGLLGYCLSNNEQECSTNTSLCFTGKTTFPSVSSSVGFNTQGCREPSGCNTTMNGTLSLIGVSYQTTIECCSVDKCNPVQLSGAPSTKMTLTAALVKSLTCNTCDVAVLGLCISDTPVKCTAKQKTCYSAVATFTSGLMPIHARGCMEDTCKNTTGSILTVNYTLTMHCCNSDLCNGAAAVQLPLTAALCAALVAVWSQWAL